MVSLLQLCVIEQTLIQQSWIFVARRNSYALRAAHTSFLVLQDLTSKYTRFHQHAVLHPDSVLLQTFNGPVPAGVTPATNAPQQAQLIAQKMQQLLPQIQKLQHVLNQGSQNGFHVLTASHTL